MINYEELKEILLKSKNIAYISVPILPKNNKYARLIYDNFAGNEGEFTVVSQYIYEHMILKKDINISRILLDIAMEEMYHLDILGQVILGVGEKPMLINSEGKEWNSKILNYEEYNLKELMEINIELEKRSILGYQNLIRYTNNIVLKRIYERIILDEKNHLLIFEKIRDEY